MQIAQIIGAKEFFDEAIRRWLDIVSTCDREKAPYEWADAHIQLGIAYARSGEGFDATELFEAARIAFESAASVYSFNHDPQNWAAIALNIGNVLREIAHRSNEASFAKEAIHFIELALAVRKDVAEDDVVTEVMCSLGQTWFTLAYNQQDVTASRRSIETLEAALRIDKASPAVRFGISWNLANSYRFSAAKEMNENLFFKSVELSKELLATISKTHDPVRWARLRENIGITYLEWYRLSRNFSHSTLATAAFDDVEPIFRRLGHNQNVKSVRENCAYLQELKRRN